MRVSLQLFALILRRHWSSAGSLPFDRRQYGSWTSTLRPRVVCLVCRRSSTGETKAQRHSSFVTVSSPYRRIYISQHWLSHGQQPAVMFSCKCKVNVHQTCIKPFPNCWIMHQTWKSASDTTWLCIWLKYLFYVWALCVCISVFQLGCFEISTACLKKYFEGKPLANQFLCRAYLCQGQLKTLSATASVVRPVVCLCVCVCVYVCVQADEVYTQWITVHIHTDFHFKWSPLPQLHKQAPLGSAAFSVWFRQQRIKLFSQFSAL